MAKRKRENADEPPVFGSKAQKTQYAGGKHAAARRQARSERTAKKAEAVQLVKEGVAQEKQEAVASGDFIPLDATDEPAQPTTGNDTIEAKPFKGKKRKLVEKAKVAGEKGRSPRSVRKEKRAAKEAAMKEALARANADGGADGEQDAKETTTASADDEVKEAKESRFIVFVGNLPFTTTTPQIQQHFRKLSPISIRHSTDPKTNKSKGFAFVELASYSEMQTALKLYHHSIFDPNRASRIEREAGSNGLDDFDGADPTRTHELKGNGKKKTEGRKINVELTAGGGGKGQKRHERIELKNKKLAVERENRKREEQKKERSKARSANANEEAAQAAPSQATIGDVHPSRMARVPNA